MISEDPPRMREASSADRCTRADRSDQRGWLTGGASPGRSGTRASGARCAASSQAAVGAAPAGPPVTRRPARSSKMDSPDAGSRAGAGRKAAERRRRRVAARRRPPRRRGAMQARGSVIRPKLAADQRYRLRTGSDAPVTPRRPHRGRHGRGRRSDRRRARESAIPGVGPPGGGAGGAMPTYGGARLCAGGGGAVDPGPAARAVLTTVVFDARPEEYGDRVRWRVRPGAFDGLRDRSGGRGDRLAGGCGQAFDGLRDRSGGRGDRLAGGCGRGLRRSS